MTQKTPNAISETLILTLLDTASRVERRLDRALSATRGISFSEYRLLQALSAFHNASAMRVELADAVRLTPSAVTRALRPLEKIGYVITEKSERDARRSLATLTAAGGELLEHAQAAVADEIADMSLASLDHAQLLDFLNRVVESFNRPFERGRR